VGSYHLQIVDKPKLGIYARACKFDWAYNLFNVSVHVGTYNSIRVCLFGREISFTVAVGDWHPKHKSHNSTQQDIDALKAKQDKAIQEEMKNVQAGT